jgi:hypothetical protein
MLRKQSQVSQSAMLQSIEIAYTAPQIITYRVSRMMLAGVAPSMRDRKEFQLMGAEKLAAMAESWNAMAFATILAVQAPTMKLFVSMVAPWMIEAAGRPSRTKQLIAARPCILSVGIAPFHRQVMANAKRLGYKTLHLTPI